MEDEQAQAADRNGRALAFYAAARAEIVQRLNMREQVLLASLIVTGVICGFAFNNPANKQALVLVAFFAFPFAMAHYRHTHLILLLGRYLHKDLGKFLGYTETNHSLAEGEPPHWDRCPALKENISSYLSMEAVVNIGMVCGPAVLALSCLTFAKVGIRPAILLAGSATTFLAVIIMFLQLIESRKG